MAIGWGWGLFLATRVEGAVPNAPDNVQPAWIYSWPGNFARITWNVVPGANTYTVQRLAESSGTWNNLLTGLTNTIAFDTDATSPERSYRVIASNGDGDGLPSAIVTTHDSPLVPYFVHQRPEVGNGTLTATSAVFSWYNSLVSGSDSMLQIGTDLNEMAVVYFDPEYRPGCTVTVSNLQPETLYYYRVTGVGPDRVGNGAVFLLTTPEINDPPVTPDITWPAIRYEYPLTIDLGVTDPDNAMYPLTFSIVTPPTNGTISAVYMINYNWPYQYFVDYTPNLGARGPDFFQYTAADGDLVSRVATVSFPDVFLNRLPALTYTETNAVEDTPLAISLAAIDPDGDPVNFQWHYVDGGTLSGSWPNFVFTPDPEFSGQAYFWYTLDDPFNLGSLGDFWISVVAANDAPVADAQSIDVPEDGVLAVTLTGSDRELATLTYTVTSAPAHGTLAGTPPNLTYTPDPNYGGPDSFSFRVNDGQIDSLPATISLTVIPTNDPPVANGQALATAEDTPLTVTLSGNDVETSTLSFLVTTAPQHGTLSGTPPNLTYTPAANYSGPDSFAFRANDGMADSASATVTLTVTPVNDPPVANGQVLSTAEDTPLTVTLSGNDVETPTLSFLVTTAPQHGTLSGTPPNLTYAPAANYSGPDSFAFRANDGMADSASATVTLTVTPVNDPPVANGQVLSTAEDTPLMVTLSGNDAETSTLSFLVTTAPQHGTLSGTPPNLTYAPALNYSGPDSFAFRANDGTVDSATATVAVTVTSVNDAPVANGQLVATAYNSVVNVTLTGSDVEGAALTYVVVTQPTGGVLGGTAPNLTFTPTVGFSGTASFMFRVSDGLANSANATVTISVSPPAGPPPAPTGVTATTVSRSQINLAWTDASALEDGFRIERSANGSTWTQIGTVGRNVSAYASTGLSANKLYYFRVRAYNVAGASVYSSIVSARTLK